MPVEIKPWGIPSDQLNRLSSEALEKAKRIALRQQALDSALRGHGYSLEGNIRDNKNLLGFTDSEIFALRDIAQNPSVNILTDDEISAEKLELMGQGRINDPRYVALEAREVELHRRAAAGQFRDGHFIPEYPDVKFGRSLAEQIAAASPQSINDLE